MTLDQLQQLCESFPGVTTDIKWDALLCFSVGNKMFLVVSPDDVPLNASFKTTEEDFEQLTEQNGFVPAPYFGRYKWVMINDLNLFTAKEWKQYAKQAYKLVFDKLPKRTQLQISDL